LWRLGLQIFFFSQQKLKQIEIILQNILDDKTWLNTARFLL
jgi:hypothetical protein